MGQMESTREPNEQARPGTADELFDQEGGDRSELHDVETDPEDHLSRPEQPDFDPAEREQYQNPRQTSIADSDHPEDR